MRETTERADRKSSGGIRTRRVPRSLSTSACIAQYRSPVRQRDVSSSSSENDGIDSSSATILAIVLFPAPIGPMNMIGFIKENIYVPAQHRTLKFSRRVLLVPRF